MPSLLVVNVQDYILCLLVLVPEAICALQVLVRAIRSKGAHTRVMMCIQRGWAILVYHLPIAINLSVFN